MNDIHVVHGCDIDQKYYKVLVDGTLLLRRGEVYAYRYVSQKYHEWSGWMIARWNGEESPLFIRKKVIIVFNDKVDNIRPRWGIS